MKLWYSIIEHSFNTQGLKKILNDAINNKANEVVLLSDTEWEIPYLTKQIVDEFKDNNISIKIVFCSNDDPYYRSLVESVGLDINNITFWGTYWIYWSRENLRWVKEFTNSTLDINNFKYPFISLNNRSHLHRCVFIDEMAKENLIDKGIVTWVKHLNENSNYPYKYFDNRQILLDDDFKTKLDSFLLPKEYNQSLFHVITEATHKTSFISEKTAIPLFMKKPFFVLSSRNFHKCLVNLGFKLYDEIIDYSFDNCVDLNDRTTLFVKNIHNILNLNLTETYKLLLPKIIHNYNRAMEIYKDKSFIPEIIKERVGVMNESKLLNDLRYVTFLNNHD